jgi:hypothetical protein
MCNGILARLTLANVMTAIAMLLKKQLLRE